LFEWGMFVYRTRHPDWAGIGAMEEFRHYQEAAGVPFSPEDLGWVDSRSALERMRVRLARRGARFVVVLFRYRTGVVLEDRAMTRLQEFGAAADVPVFDAAPFFAGRDPRELVLIPGEDPHPNVEGTALLAAGILRVLDEHGLVPTRAH